MKRREFISTAVSAAAAPMVWTAANAQSGSVRVRRDASLLTSNDPIWAIYADAVKAMHALPPTDPRNWRNQAMLHLKFCPHGQARPDFVHWHRHYITNFEAICGVLTNRADFALPYWNWSANNGRIPDALFDLQSLNVEHWKDPSGASSPNWGSGMAVNTVGTRGLRKGQGVQDDPRLSRPFTEANIASIRKETDFSAFSKRMEREPHNNAHAIVGGDDGHMGDGLSSLDPLFWLHHCGVDRVWAQWQFAGNNTPPLDVNYANQFVGGDGKPVMASSASALDIKALKFTYDVIPNSPAPFALPALQKPLGAPLKVLAGADQQLRVLPKTEATVALKAPGLLGAMESQRNFWALDGGMKTTQASERRRILARISNVMSPKARVPLIVNVFVNCPYLSPETASTDLHFAGSFSFFGMFGDGHNHGEYLVDLTEPLAALRRNGKLKEEQVNVQFMAIPVDASRDYEASFSVGHVQLVTG